MPVAIIDERKPSHRRAAGLILAAALLFPLLVLVGTAVWLCLARDPVPVGPNLVVGPACRDTIIIVSSPSGRRVTAWTVPSAKPGRTTWAVVSPGSISVPPVYSAVVTTPQPVAGATLTGPVVIWTVHGKNSGSSRVVQGRRLWEGWGLAVVGP